MDSDKAIFTAVGIGIAGVGAYYLFSNYKSVSNEELLKAVNEGRVDVINKFRGNVDSVYGANKDTPLIIACGNGNFDVVKALLARKADVSIRNNNGLTPLHMACWKNSPSTVVKELVQHGADVNSVGDSGWTPLQMCALNGNTDLVGFLLLQNADINSQNISGQSPLIMASCNGHVDVVRLLLQHDADTTLRTKQRLESPLYYATLNSHMEIMELLVMKNKNLLSLGTHDGVLPLHVAASKQNLEMIQFFVKLGVNIDEKKKDGSSVLHIAASLGEFNENLIDQLIDMGCSLVAKDAFGSTPLHRACTQKNFLVADKLIKRGAPVNIVDNDQMTPLHVLCSAPISKEHGPLIENAKKIFLILIEHGAKLDVKDMSNSTPLHHAVCREHNLPLIIEILNKDINLAFAVDQSGRTPLHIVTQLYSYQDIIDFLTEKMKEHNPDFFLTYDPNIKPISRTKSASNLLTEEQRNILGDDISLNGIAKLIKEGKIKNVLVLTGAGISTNAGIPDFRSPDKGIYKNPKLIEKLKISPQEVFTMSAFAHDPVLFYAVVKEVFLPVVNGDCKPTLAHRFIALLEKKGILLRNFTQNVDTLEKKAGVSDEKVVEAHGSFSTASCPNCGYKCNNSDTISLFWKKIESGELPTCHKCGNEKSKQVMKPDVVLFGEPLPERFFDAQKTDLDKCDLVIVMGTSLTVYPFAGIPNLVPQNIPRLLFNTEAVGPFTKGVKQIVKQETLVKIDEGDFGTYRDVAVIGDIDQSIRIFLSLLDWEI